jgi:1-acyl-sn-glycerol-3-phosphate acyltransferase
MNREQKIFYNISFQGLGRIVTDNIIPTEGEGAENVPSSKAALIVCNHRCWIDPFFLVKFIKKPIHFMGLDTHFNIPGVRQFCKNVGMISVSIEGGSRSKACIEKATEILSGPRPELVGIFPEGVSNFLNPSDDAKVIRFHTGFARIALAARVPVVPCAVVGFGEHLLLDVPGPLIGIVSKLEQFKHGAQLLSYDSVRVRIGKPIEFRKYYGREPDAEILHEVASKVKNVILDMYNDEFERGAPFVKSSGKK